MFVDLKQNVENSYRLIPVFGLLHANTGYCLCCGVALGSLKNYQVNLSKVKLASIF